MNTRTKVPSDDELNSLYKFITRKVKEFDPNKGVLSVYMKHNIYWWFMELEKGRVN